MSEIEIEVWYVIIGCSLLLLFFAAILIFILMIHQKRKFLILQKEKENQKHEYLKSLQIQHEKMEVILNERKRIAQDLHDGVGGMLAASKMLFSKTSHDLPIVLESDSFNKGLDTLSNAASEIREIAHNLMPKTLSKAGLHEALIELTDTINKTETLSIDYLNSNFNSSFSKENELIIYRIVQEVLNNVIKHAQAKHVLLHLVSKNNQLNISIEDDGIGFEIASNQLGLGLKSIQERVDVLQGKMELNSFKNEGTVVSLVIPILNIK